MKRAAIYSAILHVFVLVVLAIGLNNPFRHAALVQQPIMVEMKDIREVSTAPKLSPEVAEEVKAKPIAQEKKPEPPKPEPVQQPEPVKPEPQKPEPEKPIEKPAEAEEREPIPSPKAKPQKPEPPQEKPVPPRPRPKAEINLSKKKAPESKEKDTKKNEAAFEELLDEISKDVDKPAKAGKGAPAAKIGDVMSSSELDALRRRIYKCWLVPAGARGAKDLIVDIDMEIARDGTVKKAEIVDQSRVTSDTFFRAAAESARRAVLDPKCNPLPLPPDKYEQWKNLTLSFNPKDMF